MTRHTATTRSSTAKLTLEVQVDRDETSGYRHRWTTTVRFGLLRAIGPNLRDALAKLASEIQGLAESPGAEAGAVAERMAAHAFYDAESNPKRQSIYQGPTRAAGAAFVRRRARLRTRRPSKQTRRIDSPCP